jgi:hypothetical protein
MEPTKNIEIFDLPSSTYWYDENGILCSVSKKVPQQTLAEVIKTIEDFKKSLKTEKICMLVEVTNTVETSREVRDYVAVEFPKFIKAIAMISKSPLGIMLANLFFTIKTQPYPTKMFNSEQEAKEWLKQYL